MSSDLERLLSWPKQGQLNVVIVGAGNLGHVFVGLLSARPDVRVSFLSRKQDSDFKNGCQAGITVKLQSKKEGEEHTYVKGKGVVASSNPADVIPSADLVIITVPSHARKAIMTSIAPHLNRQKRVFVGVTPGMGGFDWIAKQICAQHKLSNVVLWGLKDVPYMSAHTVPGKSVTNLGPKQQLFLALATQTPDSKEAQVAHHLITEICKIDTVILPAFMVITLTPGNPIMHPAIMYGMFGPFSQWDGKPLPEQPLFYEGVGELSSYFLTRADTEVQNIKNAVTKMTGVELEAVWPLRLNLKKVYGDLVGDNRTLMLAMRTNRAYATIRTPLKKVEGGFTVNVDHRFFHEDVPFGLVVLRDLADILGLATPMIDELLIWHQQLMGKEYLIKTQRGMELKGKDMAETGAASQHGVKSIRELFPTKAKL